MDVHAELLHMRAFFHLSFEEIPESAWVLCDGADCAHRATHIAVRRTESVLESTEGRTIEERRDAVCPTCADWVIRLCVKLKGDMKQKGTLVE